MKKLLFFIIPLTFWAFSVQAGTGDNVSGFAWSENIGWISFNNTSGGGAISYGVNINSSDGKFSGYAWSENIGWIDFAPAGPYPASPNYSACLDFSGNGQVCDDLPGANKVGGWTRALSYGDGWDGWIKLRGSNYGVDYTPQSGELSGWAWGSDVIGWISFKGSNYVVVATATQPPQVSAAGETWDHCSFAGKSIPTLNWNYQDGTQAAYQVQIDGTSASFNNIVVDTGEISLNSQSYVPGYVFNFNKRYYWRVKAKNQSGTWSNWSNIDNFDTPQHAYPWVDFTRSPLEPTQGETVSFNPDASLTYGGSSIAAYSWSVTQGTGAFVDSTNAASRYPHIQFSTLNNKVNLQITDSDSFSCSKAKDIAVQLPLPEYKEIPPIFWLKKFFAGISTFWNWL